MIRKSCQIRPIWSIGSACSRPSRRLLYTPQNHRHRTQPDDSDNVPEERLLALAQRPSHSLQQAQLLEIQSNPASIKDFEVQRNLAVSLASSHDPIPVVDVLYKTLQRYSITCSPELAVTILNTAIMTGNLAAARRFLSLFPKQYILDPSDAILLLKSILAQLDAPTVNPGHRFGAWRRADTLSFLTGPGHCLSSMINIQGVQGDFDAALSRLGALELEPETRQQLPTGADVTERAVQQIERIFSSYPRLDNTMKT